MRLLAACLALVALQAQTFDTLDQRVEQYMKSGGVPGAAIVVVKGGAVIHSRGFGVTSVETGTPVTTKTLFRLGSTAKMFVALAALRLMDEGKLRLDQRVGDVLPDLAPAVQRVTIEQLLTHTAGFVDEAPMVGPLEESALHARVKGWDERIFVAEPGEIYSYSSPGYALLGDVIAHLAKEPFSSAMQTLVFKPMGLKDATFLPLEAFTRPVALGHDGNGVIRPFAEHAGNYPPGSLFISAEDLGRFLTTLPAETMERLAKPRATILTQDRQYGFALISDHRRGPRLVLHTGGRTGYGSIVLIAPEQRVAVAIVTNRTSATLAPAAFTALEPYVQVNDLKPPATTPVPLPAGQAAAIAGTYANGTYASVVLSEENGGLVVKFSGKSAPAIYVGGDRFYVPGGGQLETLLIVRDAQGAPRFLCVETWALRKRS